MPVEPVTSVVHNSTPAGTSPVSPIPNWLADAHDRFKADLTREGAAKSTRTDYPRRAREFVQWCLTTFGPDRAAWPIDSPARWYVARGWVGKAQGYINLATSALRAAIRWDRSQQPGHGFDIPDVEFPPSITPPKRKPRTLVGDNVSNDPNAVAADVNTPNVTATPPVPQTVMPDGAPVTPAGVPNLPGYVAPSVDIAPGITDRALAKPRAVDARRHVARNSLGALLPPGGRLRVYRTSDGTDKANPGDRVLFAEPTEKDVRGYNDIATWINETIHGVIEPLTGPRTSTTTYIVEQYDEQDRLLPPPRKIVLPNGGRGALQPMTNQVTSLGNPPPSNGPPAPGGLVDEVMKSFVKRAERYDQWQEEQLRLHTEVVEKAQRGDPTAQTQWILNQRPQPIDIKSLVEDVVTRVQDIVDKARTTATPPPAPAPLMLPPPPPAKDPLDSPLLQTLVAAATKREPLPPPPVAPDPVESFARIATILRPPVDPAVAALQSRLDQLTNELRDAKMKDPTKDPMNFFTMMKMMDDMVDRRMSRAGGGGGGIGEAIAEGIKALPEVVNALAQNQTMQPREGRPGAPQPQQAPRPQQASPQEQPQQAPQQPPAATPAQVTALRQLSEAASKNDDSGVLNALLAFIVANGAAPAPWPELNKELFNAIDKEITTSDELGYLIQRLYQLPAFGGGSLVREFPGVARKATDILAWNFPIICERLKIKPRELAGVPGVETAPPVVQAKVVATESKPEAPPPAQTPVGDEPEGDEGDEEEEDGDEPETPAEQPQGDPPPATDAAPVTPKAAVS